MNLAYIIETYILPKKKSLSRQAILNINDIVSIMSEYNKKFDIYIKLHLGSSRAAVIRSQKRLDKFDSLFYFNSSSDGVYFKLRDDLVHVKDALSNNNSITKININISEKPLSPDVIKNIRALLSISTISESLNGKSIFYPTHHIPHKRLDPSIFLPNEISNMILSGSKDQATIEQIMTSHLAQGEFKSNVISYWKQCALTKCDNLSMLVLSHIKPWVLCGNDEKQDPFNGILLLPNIALAFESGFISFDANGSILISKEFTKNINYFDVDINSSLSHYEEQHQNYLEFHRNYIFRDTRVPTKMSYLYTPNILK